MDTFLEHVGVVGLLVCGDGVILCVELGGG